MFAVSCGMILPPAFLYTLKSDLPHVFLLTSAMLAIQIFRRKPIEYSDRTVIYSVTAALVSVVIPDFMFTMNETRFGLLDIMIRSNLVAPFLLYLAALTSAFRRTPTSVGIAATLSVAAMLICGDVFNTRGLKNENLVFLNDLLPSYQVVYLAGVVVEIIFILAAFAMLQRHAKEHRRKFAAAVFILKAGCIVALPFITFGLAKLYYANESLLKTWEFYILRIGMASNTEHNSVMTVFGREVNLRSTLNPKWAEMNRKILMHVKSAQPPGYMRMNAYRDYADGKWHARADDDTTVTLGATRRAEMISYSTFYLPYADEKDRDLSQMTVYLNKIISFGVIPWNSAAEYIDAVADTAKLSADGTISMSQFQSSGAYTIHTRKNVQDAAFRMPYELEKDMLFLPDNLVPELEAFNKSLMPESGATLKDSEFLRRLLTRFNKEFKYSLSPEPCPPDSEPIAHFLLKTKSGHCELFASAAALALRQAGIPTRYITGLICEEKHPSGDYYLARVVNAHAWCEAYLRDEKRWVLVEATPPTALEFDCNSNDKWFPGEQWLNRLKQLAQELFADIRRGYFANAIISFITELSMFIWDIAKTIPGMLILILSISYFVFRRFKSIRKNASSHNRETHQLSLAFTSFEKRISKLTKIKRSNAQTLSEWAESFKDKPYYKELRDFMEEYESMRYGSPPGTQYDMTEFNTMAYSITKRIKETGK